MNNKNIFKEIAKEFISFLILATGFITGFMAIVEVISPYFTLPIIILTIGLVAYINIED